LARSGSPVCEHTPKPSGQRWFALLLLALI
jgi:hypothetical protein